MRAGFLSTINCQQITAICAVTAAGLGKKRANFSLFVGVLSFKFPQKLFDVTVNLRTVCVTTPLLFFEPTREEQVCFEAMSYRVHKHTF